MIEWNNRCRHPLIVVLNFPGGPVYKHDPTPSAVKGFDLGKHWIDLLAGDAGDVLRLGHKLGARHGAFVSGAGRR
jgi:hypothetical protein